jgi:hypothetical protein
VGVPSVQTSDAVLRITDVTHPAATDVSDEPFTVYVPPVVIYAPSPASYVFVDTEVFVNWGTSVEGITEAVNDVRPGQVQLINSNGFKEGMYLLKVTSGENSAIRKIVIKR